jgi:hypothetical protein
VPTSSARKLSGALQSKPSSSHDGAPDTLILDLEDSVAPSQKDAARDALVEALSGRTQGGTSEVAVRINAPSEGMGNGSTALRDARAVLACRGVEVSFSCVLRKQHNTHESEEDGLADDDEQTRPLCCRKSSRQQMYCPSCLSRMPSVPRCTSCLPFRVTLSLAR